MSDDKQRSLTIMSGNTSKDVHPYSYSDRVREEAFRAWIECDGNAERALRQLVKECTDANADDDMPLPHELPDASTIRRWATKHAWDALMVQAVADHFPAISAKQAARLVRHTDIAQNEYSAIMAGERDHLNAAQLNARVALITNNLQLRGLGTAGAKGGEPVVQSHQADLIDISSMTPAELARYQRQQLGQGKKGQ